MLELKKGILTKKICSFSLKSLNFLLILRATRKLFKNSAAISKLASKRLKYSTIHYVLSTILTFLIMVSTYKLKWNT
jgi:hypothetical protein